MSKFYEGQKVVCVSDNFPIIGTTASDKRKIGAQANIHPLKGETLIIDEMLGDFLRFDKYDNESFNWWHCSRFRPLDEFEITISGEIEKMVFTQLSQSASSLY